MAYAKVSIIGTASCVRFEFLYDVNGLGGSLNFKKGLVMQKQGYKVQYRYSGDLLAFLLINPFAKCRTVS